MKKWLWFKFGGLQHKILNLVLIVFIAAIGCIFVVSVTRSKELTEIVNSTREKQQTVIKERSTEVLMQSIEAAMTKTNALQAYIADDMFSDIKSDVMTLRFLAEGIFENKNSFEDIPLELPDPARAGEYTGQILGEEGVDFTKSELLKTAVHMGGTMTAMCTNTDYMYNCYIGLADGTFYMIDPHPENKYDENGNLIPIPVRQRPWYTQAVASGGICFTGVMPDTYINAPCVTCSAPVYANGELIGVVAIDLFLDSMEEYVNESAKNGGFICIVNDKGNVIFAPQGNPLFQVQMYEDSADLRKSENSELASFISSALTASTGLQEVNVDGTAYYMAGSPMDTVGWTVVSVVEKDATEQPAQLLINEYDESNRKASDTYSLSAKKLNRQTVGAMLLILVLGIIISQLLASRIVKPIEAMTEDIIEGAKSGKMFEMKNLYKTGDEIEVLANSFDNLSKKTKKYISDITAITAEKERISTELSLATQIQAAMLPHIFPPFPDRHEFEIYATMEPAREVGGDFYDFFLIDDGHLCLVMADVSGKGIPAALFMMISKTILQSCAMLGVSAGEILTKTNEALCSNNQAEMFVTVWLGILDIATGEMICANAGHEYPVLKRKDGKFELIKDKHGFAVGGMEETKYREYTLQLQKGDKLFLYTDGVPEAANPETEMFTTDRMLAALNAQPDEKPETLISVVRKAVRDFVQDAEQFDDLTMMCIEYKGAQEDREERKPDEAH